MYYVQYSNKIVSRLTNAIYKKAEDLKYLLYIVLTRT